METQIIQQLEENMVLVKGGTFLMRGNNQVTLKDFSIGKYPVTQKEWIAIMGENPSGFKGDNLPVENVNWSDVQEFIKKLNAKTGKNYRLPSQEEWEFAASGGTSSNGFEYAGSNDLDEVGWFLENSGGKTHSVGQKRSNEFGLYDMRGNVWEWCKDDNLGVLRGGSWRSSYQLKPSLEPLWKLVIRRNPPSNDDGFRLARD